MKFAIHTAVLLLLLGTTTSAFARQEEKGRSEEDKNADQAKPAQEAKPVKPAKPAQQHAQKAKPTPEQNAQQTKPAPQKQQNAQQVKPAERQQAQQAKPAPQQRTQQAQLKSGNTVSGAHGRISDAHYRASFGSSHSFHVDQGEFNRHRFQYGGYSFGFGAAWPVGWLYTDDVYVDYVDGGYYMFDPVHPGIRLSINIIV